MLKKIAILVLFLGITHMLASGQTETRKYEGRQNPDNKKMELSAEQEVKFSELKTKKKEQTAPLVDSLKQYKSSLHLLLKEGENQSQIYEHVEKIGNLKIQIEKIHIDFILGVKEILSPEQYEIFIEKQHQRNRQKHKPKNKQTPHKKGEYKKFETK